MSQRTAEKAIGLLAERMYERHGIPKQTELPEATALALARGDHVAASLSDDIRLMTMAAGLGGGSGRNGADQDTLEALKLLAVMDGLAEAKFPPRPLQAPAVKSEDDWKKSRGPYRKTRLKQSGLRAEARGLIASSAIFLIGPEEGPVRIGVSKQPMDQLRLMNRHCLLTSYIGFEGYAASNAKAQRTMREVIEYAKDRGLRHPVKTDVLMLPMGTAIEVVMRVAAQIGIALLSKEEKTRTIAEFEKTEWQREDQAFDLGG
ncbi:hypothetical protein [Hyphomicrobium sp.]|uniref:hypothetical protein n=1 Tax=Hyphomicrobium sp. TaxID=82 RepID=UPI00356A4EC2